MGRPTDCTPEVIERVVQALRLGHYADTAAAYGGISESTYYLWLKRGAAGEQPYSDFSEAVKEATAAAEMRALARIRQAADGGTWQAAAWYLERRLPGKWGRREKVEMSGPEGGPITLQGLAQMMDAGESDDDSNG